MFRLQAPAPMTIQQVQEQVTKYYKSELNLSSLVMQTFTKNAYLKGLGRGVKKLMGPLYKPLIGVHRAGAWGAVTGLGEGAKDVVSLAYQPVKYTGKKVAKITGFRK